MTEIFLEAIKSDQRFHQAVEVVQVNSQGQIWLIGGGLFRTIAGRLYGQVQPAVKDYDFIVENPRSNLVLPFNWRSETNSFGNPKLTSPDNLQIDFVYLDNLHQLRLRGLPPAIDRYLETTPLTIQSICFDLFGKQVMGEISIKAIKTKTVGVNDLEWANWYVRKYNLTLGGYIKREADKLGFTPIYR